MSMTKTRYDNFICKEIIDRTWNTANYKHALPIIKVFLDDDGTWKRLEDIGSYDGHDDEQIHYRDDGE